MIMMFISWRNIIQGVTFLGTRSDRNCNPWVRFSFVLLLCFALGGRLAPTGLPNTLFVFAHVPQGTCKGEGKSNRGKWNYQSPKGVDGCTHGKAWSHCLLAVHWQLQPTIVFSASTDLENDSLTALWFHPLSLLTISTLCVYSVLRSYYFYLNC